MYRNFTHFYAECVHTFTYPELLCDFSCTKCLLTFTYTEPLRRKSAVTTLHVIVLNHAATCIKHNRWHVWYLNITDDADDNIYNRCGWTFIDHVKKADLAQSMFRMGVGILGQVVYSHALAYGLRKIYFTGGFVYHPLVRKLLTMELQGRVNIKPQVRFYWLVADPGFFTGAPTPNLGVLSYYLAKFSPKTAWKWKELEPGWGTRPWRPVRSATVVLSFVIG